MSYILDSLKKSEDKRRQKEVPDLHTEHIQDEANRRRAWPYLVLIVLILSAGLLVWWFDFQDDESATQVAPVATPSPVKTTKGEAVQFSSKPQAVATKAPSEDSASKSSVQSLAGTAGAVDKVDAVRDETTKQASSRSSGVGVQAARSQAVEEQPSPQKTARPDNTAERTQRIYKPSELPAGVAGQVPRLKLNLHYYARQPERRMVRINGTNLREGHEVQPGLVVGEITPHGVVLEISGYRVWVEKP